VTLAPEAPAAALAYRAARSDLAKSQAENEGIEASVVVTLKYK